MFGDQLQRVSGNYKRVRMFSTHMKYLQIDEIYSCDANSKKGEQSTHVWRFDMQVRVVGRYVG